MSRARSSCSTVAVAVAAALSGGSGAPAQMVPAGSESQVNSYTTSFQAEPALGTDANGDFVVGWRSDGSSGSDSDQTSIRGQR